MKTVSHYFLLLYPITIYLHIVLVYYISIEGFGDEYFKYICDCS